MQDVPCTAAGTTPSLERALLDLAVGFVNVPLEELDAAVDRTLRTIGELSGVARTYLFTYDWERLTCTNTHEWCAPGVRSVMGQLQQTDVSGLTAWIDAHRAGRPVYRPDTADPSLDAAERTEWASQGITALLTIPLMRRGACVGFVGFDVVDGPKHWSERDREVLGVLAELLANAAERRELERLRRATEELAAANAQLGAFAGAVSHDLKAPLTTIQGMLTLLEAGRVPDERRTELLERSIAAAQRMAEMIDRLLGYAAAGREIGTPEQVSLDRVLAIARDHVEADLDARGAELVVAPLPTVLGDEVRLVEVFQNLLSNAVVHGPEGRRPAVRVRGHRHGGTVTVTVADNGSGIPSVNRARVLRSFERGPGIDRPGSGMGLPLCARIVDAHGGSMELGDSSLGGLEVSVHLPAVPTPDG
jgi:signal transduction histidine kinase